MFTKKASRFVVFTLLAIGAVFAMTRPNPVVAQPPPGHVPPVAHPKPGPSLSLLLEFEHEEVRGFWYVTGTACVLLLLSAMVPVLQMVFRSRIFVYRPYEENLLNLGRIKLKDMLHYHAQCHWGDYAAITVGMVLLSVTMLVLEKDKLKLHVEERLRELEATPLDSKGVVFTNISYLNEILSMSHAEKEIFTFAAIATRNHTYSGNLTLLLQPSSRVAGGSV